MFRKLLVFLAAILFVLLPAVPVFAAVLVTTGPAVDITATSATLTGQLTSLDTHQSVLSWFEYGTSPALGSTTTQHQYSHPGAFQSSITGLHPGATYHFRIVAMAPMPGAKPTYGAAMTFNTRTQPTPSPPPPPSSPLKVNTSEAHDITGNSAYLSGELDSTGGHSSVLLWFDWGTTTAYGNSSPRQTQTAPGPFTFPLSVLKPGITYHFRAAALPAGITTGAQPVYGVAMSFTTTSAPGLHVVTESATGVTANSTTVSGDLTSLGPSNTIVNVWFEWGTTTSYENRTTGQPQTKPDAFITTLTNLNSKTTYHYRAVAHEEVTGGTTVYGADKVFNTTPQPGLNVLTGSASAITARSAYLNGDLTLMGTYNVVEVWFEWGTTTAYGTVTARHTLNKPEALSSPINGLYSGTTYHFRAVAQAPIPGASPVYGMDKSFTAAPTPSLTVVTEPASSVTTNSAFLNGDLTSIGDYKVSEVWFEWGTTTAYGNSTPVQKHSYPVVFSTSIGNLGSDTTYHFRAVARGDVPGAPVIYGYDRTFTITPTPTLTVTTTPATGVTFASAYLNGDLLSLGNFTPVEVWFEWGLDTGYGATTQRQTCTGVLDFSAPITGLNPGTIYHFRATARPSMPGAQPVYGNDMMFTTMQTLPLAVVTELATNIKGTSATLNGDLDSLGNYNLVHVWFEWGTTTTYGNSTNALPFAEPADFSIPVTGLMPGAAYHYRVAASGLIPGATVVYGNDMTFISIPGQNPTVITETATEITTTSAILNGDLLSFNPPQPVLVYFEWGISTAYGTTTPTQERTTEGDFSAHITGLSAGTTYHYRAVAVVEDKPVYGYDIVFTTTSEPPPKPRLKVSAAPAGDISSNAAALNGILESLGNYKSVDVWFEWGKTTAYGAVTTRQTLTAPGTFSIQLAGLTQGINYHFRAVASPGEETTVVSADEIFTTPTAPEPLDMTLLLGIIICVLIVSIIIILILILRRR